jgi:hypothetical protein
MQRQEDRNVNIPYNNLYSPGANFSSNLNLSRNRRSPYDFY